MSAQLALIADDLTGALDAGIHFRNSGLSVVVSLGWPIGEDTRWPAGDADVAGLTTASRGDCPEIAASKVARAGSRIGDLPIYKKIDSTLRGNLGAELEALLRATGAHRAIIAPAFPAQGRTTVEGRQLVHGQPVSETAFANDPVCPIRESFISRALALQSDLLSELVPLETVSRGAEAVAGAIRASRTPFVVCDAATGRDLEAISRGAALASSSRLLCGSAGLAAALATMLGPGQGEFSAPADPPGGPLLVVSGSRHPATRRQVERLSMALVWLPAEDLLAARGPAQEMVELLRSSRHVAVAIAPGEAIPGAAGEIATGLASQVAVLLGRMDEAWPSGLVVTGGDIAAAVCFALGAGALRLEAEVLPGIPASTLVAGPHAGLWIVTKAGGFGDPDALENVVSWWDRCKET